MPETPEIKNLVEDINKAIAEVKTLQTDKKADENRFEKVTQDLAAMGEKMQKMQDDKKAADELIEKMQAAMARTPGGDKAKNEELIAKHGQMFDRFLRDGTFPEGVKLTEGGLEIRALSTESDPDGGFLVRPEFANFIISRIFETSPLRQVANVMTGSAKSLSFLIDDDEVEANRTGEDGASSNTGTPDTGEREIFAHKYDAEPQSTVEMLEDAALNVEQWLQGKAGDKISRLENADFVNGTTKVRGFLTYPKWAVAETYERGKIEQIALGDANNLTGDGLIDLQNSLIEAYQPSAVFLMKRSSYGKALKLKAATSGDYLFSPTFLRDGQGNLELLGKPVRFMNDMPAVGAGALAVAYGDFKRGYTIYDRRGLIVIRDIYTNKGRVKFYVSKRTGGDVTCFDSIKLGKVATSV